MKKNRINHLMALLACALFVMPVLAEENDSKKDDLSQKKLLGEIFLGLGSMQTTVMESGEMYRQGDLFKFVPLGVDVSVIHPRLPFGLGVVCYKNNILREIENEDSPAFTRRNTYYYAPQITWIKFVNEHHGFHLSASAGLMSEELRNDNPNRSNAWKYDNSLAGMVTASYDYLIDGRQGISLRGSLLSYRNAKGSVAPNPFADYWSIALSYVVYAPF